MAQSNTILFPERSGILINGPEQYYIIPRKFWDIYAHLKIFQSNIVFCLESSGTLTNSSEQYYIMLRKFWDIIYR
jgi:hypothetical protein